VASCLPAAANHELEEATDQEESTDTSESVDAVLFSPRFQPIEKIVCLLLHLGLEVRPEHSDFVAEMDYAPVDLLALLINPRGVTPANELTELAAFIALIVIPDRPTVLCNSNPSGRRVL
jgi:hypothetical protein